MKMNFSPVPCNYIKKILLYIKQHILNKILFNKIIEAEYFEITNLRKLLKNVLKINITIINLFPNS